MHGLIPTTVLAITSECLDLFRFVAFESEPRNFTQILLPVPVCFACTTAHDQGQGCVEIK